jgi:hypothetical protein
MTDVSDFLISFVPTNIYSVGTVHEIVLARSQFKPVLFVSPPVKYEFFPELDRLESGVKDLLRFYGLKENPKGIPSQWYGNIVGGHNMFDGFGWEDLAFKERDFYRALIEGVVETARPADTAGMKSWEHVREWTQDFPSLRELSGSALDHLTPSNAEEKALLDAEMAQPAERARRYFWYNRPYRPQRPMLYQLFSIASGNIPPRTNVANRIGADGAVERVTFEAVDDDWLLMTPEP